MTAAPGADTGNCARCGAPFRCGMDAGDATCWCAALPPLAVLPAASDGAAGCFCPDCLKALLAQASAAAAAPASSGND